MWMMPCAGILNGPHQLVVGLLASKCSEVLMKLIFVGCQGSREWAITDAENPRRMNWAMLLVAHAFWEDSASTECQLDLLCVKVSDLGSILVGIAVLMHFHAVQRRGHLDKASHGILFEYPNGASPLIAFVLLDAAEPRMLVACFYQ